MNLSTTIRQVQLYRSSASVKRDGRVHLPQGTTEAVIEGLSASADTNSFTLHFPQGVMGSGIRLEVPSTDPFAEKASDAVAEEIREIDEKIRILAEQADLFRKLTDKDGAIKEQIAFIEEFPDHMRKNGEKARELNKQRKVLYDRLNELKKEELKPLIHVQLTAEKEGDYPFQLCYQDNSAFWTPIYEIHSEGEGTPVEVRIRAEAHQTSGEDWNGIRLSLLTGNPGNSRSVPVLAPMYVEFYKPMPYAYNSMAGGSSRKLMAMSAPMMADADMPYAAEESADWSIEDTTQLVRMDTPQVEVTSDTMTEYTLSGEWDIPNAGTGSMIDLQAFELNAEYRVITVPKKDPRTYLCATIRSADLPTMISGDALVYLKGTYAGTVYVSPDLTDETFDLTLGRDDRFQITRKQTKRKTSESRLRGVKVREFGYEIRLTSARTEPAEVVIKDQIPVSRDKTIVVELTDRCGAEYNADTGEVVWKLTVAPQETITKTLAYTVTWPKDKTVTGI